MVNKNSRIIVFLDGLRVFLIVYKFVYNMSYIDFCKKCKEKGIKIEKL